MRGELVNSSKNRITFKPRFRVMRGKEIALGPGKIDLLEAIRRASSISGAARDLGLSYKRAWDLVDIMNRSFKKPLVTPSAGGRGGGGSCLTRMGAHMVSLYRDMERKAETAISSEWKKISQALKKNNF